MPTIRRRDRGDSNLKSSSINVCGIVSAMIAPFLIDDINHDENSIPRSRCDPECKIVELEHFIPEIRELVGNCDAELRIVDRKTCVLARSSS